MWSAKPSARLPALLLLALALSPPGTHGRPRGRRAARPAELKSQLLLPVTGTRQAPRASRSAGPVTFSAECSKHFHRLYHNTRDCSMPACKLPGQI
ncbi:ALK and LTK ligand 1 [Cricetulus griseus]